MQYEIIRAGSRGHAQFGWLDSYHSFSFGQYYDPGRMGFGVLRVLNDDSVAPGRGFDTHAHDNMEIVSIPLEGDLEHKDSMGNATVIRQGDIQVMSAGTGVRHSEYNKSSEDHVKFLQIWIIPRERNVAPRYDQISIDHLKKDGEFSQILSPNAEDNGVWVHQDAWMHWGEFQDGNEIIYTPKSRENGVYALVLEGKVKFGQDHLGPRDAIQITEPGDLAFKTDSSAKVLLIEVPLG